MKTHNTNKEYLSKKKEYHQNTWRIKPHGLWYEINNSWVIWCKHNTDWKYKHRFQLDTSDLNILKVHHPDELNCYKINLCPEIENFNYFLIDWDKIKKKYDGIEFPTWRRNYSLDKDHIWWYALDCKSGCIWNIKKLKWKKLNNLKLFLKKKGIKMNSLKQS